jgi:hypothetical protein
MLIRFKATNGFGQDIRQLFWKAAYTFNPDKFKSIMNEIKAINPIAYDYINNIPYNTWASYAFGSPRFGYITSNIVESLNAKFKEIRDLPVLQIQLGLWSNCLQTINQRSKTQFKSNDWTDYCYYRLELAFQESRRYHVITASPSIYQVEVGNNRSVVRYPSI